ncbi:hypothetical protein TELCIR_09100 [Teladorsagia circumcincta]|uniref:Uncharacterized protein n=1 Tax=Teladorsagia circumcincta TaxID=45464 RepID=A0A2G9UH78_TELCI|nr:hypothetical protein TELCIR_09100 [Teladorsagia circumcincta]
MCRAIGKEQVDAIHQDLKLFNTQFRELQKQTNEVLEQKGARHFHFVIQGSPTKYKVSSHDDLKVFLSSCQAFSPMLSLLMPLVLFPQEDGRDSSFS